MGGKNVKIFVLFLIIENYIYRKSLATAKGMVDSIFVCRAGS